MLHKRFIGVHNCRSEQADGNVLNQFSNLRGCEIAILVTARCGRVIETQPRILSLQPEEQGCIGHADGHLVVPADNGGREVDRDPNRTSAQGGTGYQRET